MVDPRWSGRENRPGYPVDFSASQNFARGSVDVVTIAQLITSITNILFVAVLALGYYFTVKASRDTLSEMHAQRVAGGVRKS